MAAGRGRRAVAPVSHVVWWGKQIGSEHVGDAS